MNLQALKSLIEHGEDSSRQFKVDVRNADSLASELVAFSNSHGGVIFIGVTDHGAIKGLSPEAVRRVNQLVSNAATQHIRGPITPRTENIKVGQGLFVVVVTVPEGIDKPYFDRYGIIWVKSGADKRRIQSKEELRRLFQDADLLHADILPTTAGIEDLDQLRFRDFLTAAFHENMPENAETLGILLNNMNLARGDKLNLTGLLLFGRFPQAIKPAFVIKAVRYPGMTIDCDNYLDGEDMDGTLDTQFRKAQSFILRNLPKTQGNRGINTPGRPIVPPIVFEELLVNALIHRDYFIQAPVRLYVFEDRIEIVNPGTLPNHLTVEKIKAGNSILRNPIISSFAARELLPWRGLGTGIRRVLAVWPSVTFLDDRDANTFTVTVPLTPLDTTSTQRHEGASGAPITGQNAPLKRKSATEIAPLNAVQSAIMECIAVTPTITIMEMAMSIGKDRATITRNIAKLKESGLIVRVGPKKKGYWKIVEGR